MPMANHHTSFGALAAAVQRAGSQAALAKICNVSSTAVWKWMQSSKRLPAEHVLAVEAATGVSRHELRPDIYPREFDVAPSPSAIGEPYYECGPILSVRAQARNGNRAGVLAHGGAA